MPTFKKFSYNDITAKILRIKNAFNVRFYDNIFFYVYMSVFMRMCVYKSVCMR